MVTALVAASRDLSVALQQLSSIKAQREAAAVSSNAGKAKQVPVYDCFWCPQGGLPEDALHAHLPLFHANTPQRHALPCPICRTHSRRLGVHVYNDHGPPGRGEQPSESRTQPSTLHPFSLVIVRRPRDGRFLVVQEFANSGYWLPGGRCENGETLSRAAVRETLEEAGVHVSLKGILRMEYSSEVDPNDKFREGMGHARLRVLFYAEPIDVADSPADACKTLPDYESVGAAWVTVDELKLMCLRGSEPLKWFPYVAEGGTIFPMHVLRD
jgi:8-oxo-dGTP pyrophosphatase MutT (NUDIX family)